MSPGKIMYTVAVVCFVVAAIPITPPVSMMALGLVFFTLGHIVT